MAAYAKKYTFAPLPHTIRGESIKLDSDPKGKNFLYANGKSIFIRDIQNPSLATEYVGHNAQTTVARYSPSGFYIASGDAHGNVRIWDTVNEEHLLKNEIRPISNKIKDIAWDADSQRLIAVGDGKERFGHTFAFDTLSSTGEITGHSKVINSVSIRKQRPFRAVTASDDMTVAFYHGVPFKYNKTIRDHSRFVHAVEFSPNGDYFVSAGADAKLFLYDGKTGDKIDEFSSENGHKGSIFSVAWSPDSKQLLTSSADCTAKIWDVSAKSVVNTFEISSSSDAVDNQQVGSLWQGDWILSTSLSGEINYLDKNTGKVSHSISGHAKAITALAITKDDTLYTGSYDGRVCAWSLGDEGDQTKAMSLRGECHSNLVVGLEADGDRVFSAGMDDMVRVADTSSKSFSGKLTSIGSMPVSISSRQGVSAVATAESVLILDAEGKKLIQHDKLGYSPKSVSLDASGKYVFVGGDDNKIHMYEIQGSELKTLRDMGNHLGYISALAAHPTLNLLAVGDSVGKIFLYDTESGETVLQSWVFHTGRITGLQWSPCGIFLVSGSIDTNVYVWNREKKLRKVAIKNAHVDAVNDVGFLNQSSDSAKINVVSVGQDAAVRVWEVTKPQ
ncbi:WD40-repeat-containing domain protein [Syncephalastrum racemosum]|uniref:WD40-repeat-containing domain protein n=1 Tax=Syncephalastrum racemosum TaxID=13706 RepID=A0A1X2HQ68_SYNRA|nr:WD40-repeat-containing domain protein [Syncephalastrum racemosum]